MIAESWDGPTKVGVSDDPHERLRKLQTGNPRPLGLLGYIQFGNRSAADCVEWILKDYLRETRTYRGGEEWFAVNAEWFLLMLQTFPLVYREIKPLSPRPADDQEFGDWIDSQTVDLISKYQGTVPERFSDVISALEEAYYSCWEEEMGEVHTWREWYEIAFGRQR